MAFYIDGGVRVGCNSRLGAEEKHIKIEGKDNTDNNS